MGFKGPAPTPTPILAARGSWRANTRSGEPQFTSGAGSCPSWLSKEAKAEWRRVVKELARQKVVQQVDRATLAAYCEAWGEFVQLRADVDAMRAVAAKLVEPLKYEALSAESLNKLVRLKNAAADRMAKLAAQFGFTPSARARLTGAGGDEAEADPFEDFLRDGARKRA